MPSVSLGEFRSIDRVFSFEESDGKIAAKTKRVSDAEYAPCDFDKSCFDSLKFPITCLSDEQKVKFCLKNPHLRAAIDEKTQKVFFNTISPAKKIWKDSSKIDLHVLGTKMIPLSEGSLVLMMPRMFAQRFVRIWDPRSNTLKILNSPNFNKCFDATELDNGFLAMTTFCGILEIWDWKNERFLDEIKFENEKIVKIRAFSENLIATCTSDNLIIYDYYQKEIIQQIPNIKLVEKISDKSFVCKKNENTIEIYSKSEKNKSFELEKHYDLELQEDQVIDKFSVLSNGNILIIYRSTTGNNELQVKIFNPQDKSSIELEKSYLVVDADFCEIEIEIEGKRQYCIANGLNKRAQIGYWNYETGKFLKTDSRCGSWDLTITSLIQLADNSLVSGSRNGQVKIFDPSREENPFHTKISDREIAVIQELFDGSVAIQFKHNSVNEIGPSIEIIYPIRDSEDDINREDLNIDELKDRLREYPQDFKTYDYLAKKIEDDMEKYHLYLLGIQEAMRANHKYRARRFYEKATNLKRADKTSHMVYLSFLDDSLDKKEKRMVYKNLYKLFLNDGYLEEYKKLAKKRFKKRLIIGDGNFSFTEDLIHQHKDTHPNLAGSIVATEVTDCSLDDREISERVKRLMKQNVKLFFDIDATTIHQRFSNKRFERIHWNCPYGSCGPIQDQIKQFFVSAGHLQIPLDRVHMVLAQEFDIIKERQGYDYKIVRAATLAGYRLVRKREFSNRFPNYTHLKTNGEGSYSGRTREFIFEKMPLEEFLEKMEKKSPDTEFLEFANSLKRSSEKNFEVKSDRITTKLRNRPDQVISEYFECSTDQDTTDYFETDSDNEGNIDAIVLSKEETGITDSSKCPEEDMPDKKVK